MDKEGGYVGTSVRDGELIGNDFSAMDEIIAFKDDGPFANKEDLKRFNLYAKIARDVGERSKLTLSFMSYGSGWNGSGQLPARAVCGEGEEGRVRQLAAYVDRQVADLARGQTQVGDARLLLMASLLVADKLSDAFDEIKQLRAALDGRAEDAVSDAWDHMENAVRLADGIAALGAEPDPAQLRQRNLVPAERFPFRTPSGETLDSGDYRRTLERACEQAGYAALRAEQAERRAIRLVNPNLPIKSTSHTLQVTFSIVNPGEVARAHRHNMAAIRFVVQGRGAYTAVDGEKFFVMKEEEGEPNSETIVELLERRGGLARDLAQRPARAAQREHPPDRTAAQPEWNDLDPGPVRQRLAQFGQTGRVELGPEYRRLLQHRGGRDVAAQLDVHRLQARRRLLDVGHALLATDAGDGRRGAERRMPGERQLLGHRPDPVAVGRRLPRRGLQERRLRQPHPGPAHPRRPARFLVCFDSFRGRRQHFDLGLHARLCPGSGRGHDVPRHQMKRTAVEISC